MMPHSPHNPPERLLAKYREKATSLEIAKYWAMCEWFDETCGELLDHLEKRKLADNTLVIFLADNGWIQDPEADRYAAALETIALRRRAANADPGALAWQGRSANLRHPGERD